MGSIYFVKESKQRGWAPGKINASLNEKLSNIEWGEYSLGDLFEIENTLSFNTDKLVSGNDYDYVTRTSLNQGILQTTGFVNKENINPAGTWSLGLLQMDFFYRSKPWYAGQFVRKIIPKIEIRESSILFFSTLLNKQKPRLLSILVRNVDVQKVISVDRGLQELIKFDNNILFPYVKKLLEQLKIAVDPSPMAFL